MRFFSKKSENFERGKIGKFDEERVFFREKTFSPFPKPSLQKYEDAKYAAGCRPSCYTF